MKEEGGQKKSPTRVETVNEGLRGFALGPSLHALKVHPNAKSKTN